MRFRPLFLTLGVLPLVPSAAAAQANLTAVYPNGGQAGTTVKLKLTGADLPDNGVLMVEGTGIRPAGPFVKGEGSVELDAAAEPGVRQIRLVGASKASSPRPFVVGRLPELLETEPNNTPSQAQALTALPVTLNGTLPTRADVDHFRVRLEQGQCLVLAGESRVLGAPTNLLLRIRDLRGRELAVQMDQRTRDPLLGFSAPEAGEYVVEVSEIMNNYSSVDATYVYRLTVTTGPWIDSVFPMGARSGVNSRLTFRGWNLDGRAGPGETTLDYTPSVPAGARVSVSAGGAANSVLLEVGGHPDASEPAGDRGGADPVLVQIPVAINGTLGQRGDRDVYRFSAQGGTPLLLDAAARRLHSYADPLLIVRDASGKILATSDDSDGQRDPLLTWTPPSDGEYQAELRDVAGRGGPGYTYRLTIGPPQPALDVTTDAVTTVLAPGKSVELAIRLSRRHGAGEPALEVEGLPAGVTANEPEGGSAEGGAGRGRRGRRAPEVKLKLTATPDAKPGAYVIRVKAAADRLPAVTATATWVLATDRSGTLAEGSTQSLLLLIPEPAAAPPPK